MTGRACARPSRSRRCARSPRKPQAAASSTSSWHSSSALRESEAPDGIEEAEEAVRALQRTIGTPPHLATPARLDEIGVATRRLEQALDPLAGSPFAGAMRSASAAVEELTAEVEATYRVELI